MHRRLEMLESSPTRRLRSAAACLALTLGLLVSGCGKSGVAAEIASFKTRGHSVSNFTDTDSSAFGAKKCQTGTVDQLPVLLCEYENGDAAALSQPAAESWGGATGTVVVLHRGSMLFAVADRDHADESGQKISALAGVFRRVKAR
jgi:hypothetical protein